MTESKLFELKSKPPDDINQSHIDPTLNTMKKPHLTIKPERRSKQEQPPDSNNLSQIDPPLNTVKKPHLTIKPERRSKQKSINDLILQTQSADAKNNLTSQKTESHWPLFSRQKRDVFCIKTSLKSIVINREVHQELNQIVIACHQLMTRAYEFIRLYLLKKYIDINHSLDLKNITVPPPTLFPMNPRKLEIWEDQQRNPPTNKNKIVHPETFDAEIFEYFIRACAQCNACGAKPAFKEIREELDSFYQQEFQPCLDNQQMYDRTNMSHLIDDMAIQMKTCFTVAIKNHFVTRLRHLMNVLKPEVGLDTKVFGKMKNQILKNKSKKIDPQYSEWVRKVMSCLPPLETGNYGIDCKMYPEKYLFYQIKINELIEQYNHEHTSESQSKLYQPIPMRTSWIPCYASISTDSIAESIESARIYLNKGNRKNRQNIWDCIFVMDRKIFKQKGYELKSFQTNGVSVSLCFSKLNRRRGQKTNSKQIDTDVYVDDLTPEELWVARTLSLVGDDPGKDSPAYMMNSKKEKLRYSTAERRLRSGYNLEQRVLLQEKNSTPLVLEAELKLAEQTYKTIDYNQFKECIRLRDRLSNVMMSFYQRELFRKMKWRVWLRQRQFEDQFLNRIEQTYGSPQEILICCGNWGTPYQMKHLYPSQGKGMRKLLRRRFHIVLVDEFRTSKLCNQCHHELKEHCGEYRLRLCPECKKCNSLSNKKSYIFHRDANGAMNILNIAQSMIHEGIRPECFCRVKHENNVVLESVSSHPAVGESSDDNGTKPCTVSAGGGDSPNNFGLIS
jgi:hypothetical protein